MESQSLKILEEIDRFLSEPGLERPLLRRLPDQSVVRYSFFFHLRLSDYAFSFADPPKMSFHPVYSEPSGQDCGWEIWVPLA